MSALLAMSENQKPAPFVSGDEVAQVCPKCNGTGFYCMGTENGKPYSFTGFDCHPCEATGWIVRSKANIEKSERAAARRAQKWEDEREERELSRAIELDEVAGILNDMVPRVARIYGELKEGTDAQRLAAEFMLRAEEFQANRNSYCGQYGINPKAVRETLVPIVMKWEDIMESRAKEAEISQYVGRNGDPITFVAVVTFVTSFESQFGTKFLTILKDEHGNVLKYWNTLNFIDPIQSEAQGHPVTRTGCKGDKVRFKATVKGHEEYKGVKGTVLQRARKCELIQAGE